jgi:flagellar basal-body rod modification protein FlgD
MTINPLSDSTSNNQDKQTTANTPDPLKDKNTFLQLLVAQLKYQDPSQPADGLQFVTQLAQFTTLEQQVQMTEDLGAIRALLAAQAESTTTT